MNRLLVALGAVLVVAGLQVLFPDHDDANRQRACFADLVVDAAVENASSRVR